MSESECNRSVPQSDHQQIASKRPLWACHVFHALNHEDEGTERLLLFVHIADLELRKYVK